MAVDTEWIDLDESDASSFAETFASTSTIPGIGSTAGKFLKTLGEKSLDLVVNVIIRSRLASIERILGKNPYLLRYPTGEKEWKKVVGIYKDLHELCRESRSAYYSLSHQRAAAHLVRAITILTRPVPDKSIDAAPTNQKWEELFAHVQSREELMSVPRRSKRIVSGSYSSFNPQRETKSNGNLFRARSKGARWDESSNATTVEKHKQKLSTPPNTLSESRTSELGHPPHDTQILEAPHNYPLPLPSQIRKSTSTKRALTPRYKTSMQIAERVGTARKRRNIGNTRTLGRRFPRTLPQAARPITEIFSQDLSYGTPPDPSTQTVETPSEQPCVDSTRTVVILGPEGSGKSTLLKQLRYSMDRGKEAASQDAVVYRDLIIHSTWRSMRTILSKISASAVSPSARTAYWRVARHICPCDPLDVFCCDCSLMGFAIQKLWEEPAVRRHARKMRLGILHETGGELSHPANYFFDSALRIFEREYMPTPADILHCPGIRTTGIDTQKFSIGDTPWTVIDTCGGEPTGRNRWLNCISNITAMVFVVALTDYNKPVNEDGTGNRMRDTLISFQSAVHSLWDMNPLIILLFTKIDIFQEQLIDVPLEDYFPDYIGRTFPQACEYFETLFLSLFEEDKLNVPITVKYTRTNDEELGPRTIKAFKEDIDDYCKQKKEEKTDG